MKLANRKARPLKNSFEKQAWSQQQVVCGIDEVGRGCLAGPLVAAAVILHPNRKSPLLKDSKLLTKEELLKGYAWIIRNSWYAWGIISHTDIDKFNIYQANLMVMRRATL